ncbi:GNAT family N-acetyltransferase [Nisaea acidiphila]|uniref:GNAT family N-acetyltransferase n=1 Tax=Nisaea acidiphila TaxID=1862145 RepID=A0A9J7APD0_9PROT|nr:GNAT family N-acetyltransferase [Nisaea acidiphila]UUX49475.1 GNAT family N-acetyltransferase [Nisaea acidiphila]
MAADRIGIRPMIAEDAPRVLAIYQAGIETGQATFESVAPDWPQFDEKYLPDCRLVALSGKEVVGWIALTPVSKRSVYAGVAEHSLYIAAHARGRGVGRLLLRELIEASERAGFWTLQTSIFPENEASIGLHESCGFRTVGRRERIAKMTYGPMEGQWRDTVIMERRSAVAGR